MTYKNKTNKGKGRTNSEIRRRNEDSEMRNENNRPAESCRPVERVGVLLPALPEHPSDQDPVKDLRRGTGGGLFVATTRDPSSGQVWRQRG
jgi:hypothetical protein